MDHFLFEELVNILNDLSRTSPLAEDRFLCLDIDLLRDLRLTERRRLLKKARTELMRRSCQERVDEIAEAFDNDDSILVEVLGEAFPSDLLNFRELTERQRKRWLTKAELAAVGVNDNLVAGDEYIYFISGDDARVKIGYTTDLRTRVSSLQTGSSRKLEVIFYFLGDREKEAELHQKFSSDRLHGEWFTLSPAIQSFIHDFKSES